jgi:hypothetical protein
MKAGAKGARFFCASDLIVSLFLTQHPVGKHPAFQYGPSNAGRGLAACEILKSDLGRVWTLTVTKTW